MFADSPRELDKDHFLVLLEVLRETAVKMSGATAAAIYVRSHRQNSQSPAASLAPATPLGAALLAHCRLACKRAHGAGPAPADIVELSPIQDAGRSYSVFALTFTRSTSERLGAIAFAWPDTAAPNIAIRDTWRLMAQCVETLIVASDSIAGLELDIHALNDRASRLQRMAEVDPLTKLENAPSFKEKALSLIETKSPLAMVMVDIDHFKLVNDLYGHQFGDMYLKTVSKSFRSSFPDTSVIGRLGGDEFGIICHLPPSGRSYLEGLLSRCRSSVQRACALLGKPDLGRISIGASQCPAHGDGYDALFQSADAALYAAKASGRSASVIFHPSRHDRYNNAELGKKFRAALKEDRILPYFQPVINLHNGQCEGFEVLARWRTADGALQGPSEFGAVFRDHTLAETLTRTIMSRAFADYMQHIAPRGRPLKLALNVTHFDLMNPEFAFEVQSAVYDSGLSWTTLVIEVTEQIMLGETNGQVFRSLNELRARGANIALDDFGTGYGGLRHLADWPIDALKIDKFFVDGLHAGNRDRAVVEAIMAMARKLGYRVIAEGIERESQVGLLRELGCDAGQGYALAKPIAGSELDQARDVYVLPTG
ncbi:putative bifunctional diguanylate cyclase/phosphodiesterase [Pseudooceanicola sp. C21-150M6]